MGQVLLLDSLMVLNVWWMTKKQIGFFCINDQKEKTKTKKKHDF